MDLAVILTALSGFILFLILHIVCLRIMRTQAASKMIVLSIILGFIGGIVFYGAGLMIWILPAGYSVPAAVLGALIAFFIYVFLIFHYIAWIFGMGEAAIRIRLLFEIEKFQSGGATLEGVYEHYNAKKILSTRLSRLLNAGHIAHEGTRYEIRNRALLFQIYLSRLLKSLMGLS